MNWNQLQTILWLRWRLMCNQWRKSGGLGAVFSVIITIIALGLGVISFVAGLLGGVFGLAKQSPQVIMFVCLGITVLFLFFWLIGLMTELQRSEAIDLQKLMHLPVALGQMFTINYLASHFTLALVIFVPAMTGLGLALAFARGPLLILLIPLAWSMVLMITAWTYYLRGWLASLMSNPRRRRAIIMAITLCFVLLAQGPNLYFNVFQRHHSGGENAQQREAINLETKHFFDDLKALQGFVPPLWVPMGAQALAEGNPWPALLATLGCAGIAALGLRLAYRATLRFYQGEAGSKATARKILPAGPKATRVPRRRESKEFLEYSIPFAPEQSTALALATFRSLLRAPEVKMAWASSFIATLIICASFLFRSSANVTEVWKPFVATASVVFPIFFLVQFFGNQFGLDRDGFRSLILSPADRRLILLGKNLAALPVGLVFGTLLVVIASLRLHLSPLTTLATLFQLASVLLMAAVAGNFLSLMAPYRIQPGSMKPTKMPGLATLLLVLSHLVFPMAMLPVFVGPALEFCWRKLDWPGFVPVNLLVSALFAGLMVLLYWLALAPLGRLLQRRETKILSIITVEIE
jgi:hypothetical protein